MWGKSSMESIALICVLTVSELATDSNFEKLSMNHCWRNNVKDIRLLSSTSSRFKPVQQRTEIHNIIIRFMSCPSVNWTALSKYGYDAKRLSHARDRTVNFTVVPVDGDANLCDSISFGTTNLIISSGNHIFFQRNIFQPFNRLLSKLLLVIAGFNCSDMEWRYCYYRVSFKDIFWFSCMLLM